MIENKKPLIMLLFAAILSLISLVYGFSKIPTPAQQHEIKIDHKRVSDLGQINYSIKEYARTNGQLPATLDAITDNSYSPGTPLDKKDPETDKYYDYIITAPTNYRLCTTFAMDGGKEGEAYDQDNYRYDSFKKEFTHPKGYYCFDNSVILQNQSPLEKLWPTLVPPNQGVNIMPFPIGTGAATPAPTYHPL